MIHAVSLLTLVALSETPERTEPLTVEAMRTTMHDYFDGELTEGWAFGGLGLAGVGTGVALFASGGDLRRGASIPLMGIGLLQLLLSVGLRIRTPGQITHFDSLLDSNASAYGDEERARMLKVNRGFPLYAGVEIGLFFAGIVLAGAGGIVQSDFALGAGLTLALEAVTMLVLDHLAGLRGKKYESALRGFRF